MLLDALALRVMLSAPYAPDAVLTFAAHAMPRSYVYVAMSLFDIDDRCLRRNMLPRHACAHALLRDVHAR